MKKLLLTLTAGFAMTLASHAAGIAYYYGTDTKGTLPSNGNAGVSVKGTLAVVDTTSGLIRFITLTVPSTNSAKKFDYKIDAVATGFRLTNITSTNGASFSFYTIAVNGDTAQATSERIADLVGANSSVRLNGNNQPTVKVPFALAGTDTVLNVTTTPGTGTATVDTYALQLQLSASQLSNQNNRTLNQAVADADTFFEGLGGNKLP